MIDSEACRLALSHYGIAYREAAHVFGWASLLAVRYGCTIQIPLLFGSGVRLAGPRQIVSHFDARCPPERRLVPVDKVMSDQVAADWKRFNGTLGFATARFAYYHLLKHRAIMIEPFSRGVPACEASALKSAYPVFSGMFKVLLCLCARRARAASERIRSIFDETDHRLRDRRRFLFGDRFTLSDLALVTSAAPLLVPEGFGSPMPPLDQMPPEMISINAELSQRETAHFVRRIYREFGTMEETKVKVAAP